MMTSLPSATRILPLAMNVPANTTFLALCVMSMKPPGPDRRLPNFETFRLPSLSASARPSTVMSRPPPSMKSNIELCEMMASAL